MKNIKRLLHHLFIPSISNNYRARILRHDFLALYLLLAFSLVALSKHPIPQLSNVLGFATDISSQKLLELTNQERAKQNLQPLSYNSKLAIAAQKKAADMFTHDYWAHYSPQGRTPWDFVLDSGYSYEYVGENLAKNFLFSNNVVTAWMNSPTHRENIIKPEYTEVGFAVVNGVLAGEETTLVVQMLGKPQSKALSQDLQRPQNTRVAAEIVGPPTRQGESLVLANSSARPAINILPFSINAGILMIIVILVALISDFYIAARMKLFRMHGRNLAHFIFLFFVLVAVAFFIMRGAIL